MTDDAHHGRPRLVVSPSRPTLDSLLHIRLDDLPPSCEVRLRANTTDLGGREWRSWATFHAADGTVDLHRDAPVAGSYQGIDPMGLVWSMEPAEEPAGKPPPAAPADFLAPAPFRVVAEVDGMPVVTTQVLRLRVPDGLSRCDVRHHDLVGTLYYPRGVDPLPGVLMLGGAEGGMHEDDAALLAANGYAALALAYYGVPGLPATAQDIPLEYFGRALGYLQRHPRARADRLAVMGGSKGGEAALLIAATFPQVRATISVVGSGVVTQGISQDVVTGSLLEILRTPVANWAYRGRALPYLPNIVTPELTAAVAAGEPVTLRMAFTPGLAHTDLLVAATIPVERIRGAVLLISSEDDAGYGAAFHEVAAQRLVAHNHPYAWKHIVYEGAGHHIAKPPYGPTTNSLSPGPGVTFRGGGTPAGNARARAGAWNETLRFLAREIAG